MVGANLVDVRAVVPIFGKCTIGTGVFKEYSSNSGFRGGNRDKAILFDWL